MSLKILVIGQTPPPVHGSNIMTETFTRSLESLGHRVNLLEKKFSTKQEGIGKISIRKILRGPYIICKLLKKVSRSDLDICFYFLSLKPPSFQFDAVLLLLLKFFKLRYIIYLHGKGLAQLVTDSDILSRFLARKIIMHSYGILIVGDILRYDVCGLIGEDKIFVLPNAIADVDLDNLNRINNEDHHVTILYLSNLRPSKGVMEFLKMAYEVKKKCDNVRFILAGSTRSKKFANQIESFLSLKKLKECFNMPGAVYGYEKDRIFKKSDIFVFPSKKEAFGLVNLEAMQWALPVVASNQGAIPKIVRNGESGFIIDPKDIKQIVDRVVMLIRNPGLRDKMGKRGRIIYENKFSINVYTNRVREAIIFFKLISKHDHFTSKN